MTTAMAKGILYWAIPIYKPERWNTQDKMVVSQVLLVELICTNSSVTCS